MTRERQGTATVLGQEGTVLRVKHHGEQLTASMVGFPPAFRLRLGERVILADEPSGLTARPLVRAIKSRITREAFERDRQVEVGGQQLMTQDNTVVEFESGEVARPSEEATLWVVEPGDADGPGQVIAARWPRR